MLPVALNRLDHQLRFGHPNLPEPPSVTARRFYYDTVGHGSDVALLCAWKAFGAGQLLPGSDWPVLLIDESYSETFG
jgi:aminocarboxymuconate-semialdehyde decarboxylase